jgi:hypothetical protein
MITCFYPTDKPVHKQVMSNLVNGLGPKQARLQSIDTFLANRKFPAGTTSVAFAGLIRGFGDLYKFCLENAVPFYYIDHAYFDAGYNTTHKWMRVTKNGFVQNKLITDAVPIKFNKYFSHIKLEPWKKRRGDHILLIPPTDSVSYVFGTKHWAENTMIEIKKYTDLPIKIREKERKLLLNSDGSIDKWTKLQYDTTLAQDIETAHAVVAYNSNVAVDAAIKGVPVFTSDNCAAYPISNAIKDIENPHLHHREQWLWSLADSQFCRKEFLNDTVLKSVK